jgi:hypothetical protein
MEIGFRESRRFLPSPGSRERKNPKGGNGVLNLSNKNGILTGHRGIILGLNVENYPAGSSPASK